MPPVLRSFPKFQDTPSTEEAPAPKQPTLGLSSSIPDVGFQIAVAFWVQFVMVGLRGWTIQSVTMWCELTSYRLEKAYHYKSTTRNEHEFVIYEFTDKHKNKLELRSDRSVGEPKNGSSPSSFGISVGGSPSISTPPPWPSSSSSPFSSENERNFNMSMAPSDTLSDVSSNRRLADDTVAQIKGPPPHSQVRRTITFNGDHSLRPSLWDVMILVLVVHNDSALYTLKRQCYWFADTIFGSLEKWAENHNNGTVTCEKGKRRALTGNMGILAVHRRNAGHIDKVWADFNKQWRVMTQEKEEYERARTEEIEKMRQLADEVRKLKYQLKLQSECQTIMPHLQRHGSITYDEDILGYPPALISAHQFPVIVGL